MALKSPPGGVAGLSEAIGCTAPHSINGGDQRPQRRVRRESGRMNTRQDRPGPTPQPNRSKTRGRSDAETGQGLTLGWPAQGRSSAAWRGDQLGLGHDGREPAVAADDAGLPDHRGASAVQRRAFGANGVAGRYGSEEIGLALDG